MSTPDLDPFDSNDSKQWLLAELSSFRGELEAAGVDVRQVLATRDLNSDRPTKVDRFQVDRLIGQGGCGNVYRAFDPDLERWIALKVPLPHLAAKADFRKRFLFEAKAMARVSHPHIVPVYDIGGADKFDSPCYIATELCPGSSLAGWLADHSDPVARLSVVSVLPLLADALHHVHQSAIVHRDVKPSNILLFPNEDAGAEDPFPYTAKLTDFGLAKSTAETAQQTTTMGIAGTLKYMAPEQVQGRRDRIGPATDVYALGVLLYEVLAGCVPFESENTFELGNQIVSVNPPTLPDGTPPALAAICRRCLEKKSTDRYASAAELADDLRRYLTGAIPQTMLDQHAGRTTRRRFMLVGAIAIASVLAAINVWRTGSPPVETNPATTSSVVAAIDSVGKPRAARYAETPYQELIGAYLESDGNEGLLAQAVALVQQEPVHRFIHPQTNQTHLYQLVSLQRPVTWDRAAELASQMVYDQRAGHLVTVTDLAEADFLRVSFLMNRTAARRQIVWIGLSRDPSDATWQWVNGELMLEYKDWFPGQPADDPNADIVAAAYLFNDNYGIPNWRWGSFATDDPTAKYFLVEYEPATE